MSVPGEPKLLYSVVWGFLLEQDLVQRKPEHQFTRIANEGCIVQLPFMLS